MYEQWVKWDERDLEFAIAIQVRYGGKDVNAFLEKYNMSQKADFPPLSMDECQHARLLKLHSFIRRRQGAHSGGVHMLEDEESNSHSPRAKKLRRQKCKRCGYPVMDKEMAELEDYQDSLQAYPVHQRCLTLAERQQLYSERTASRVNTIYRETVERTLKEVFYDLKSLAEINKDGWKSPLGDLDYMETADWALHQFWPRLKRQLVYLSEKLSSAEQQQLAQVVGQDLDTKNSYWKKLFQDTFLPMYKDWLEQRDE
jgi:hypothetical protein